VSETFLGMKVQPPARAVPAPEGWEATPLVDPFEAFVGPFFSRAEGEARAFAFLCDERHVNQGGVCHGGQLMTFIDHAFGYHFWMATGGGWAVTVSQQTQFLKPVRPGDLVTVRPVVTRKTKSMIFMRGDFLCGDDIAVTASALWKIVK
jgi:uncharacterized protein (TIGR00369 family)